MSRATRRTIVVATAGVGLAAAVALVPEGRYAVLAVAAEAAAIIVVFRRWRIRRRTRRPAAPAWIPEDRVATLARAGIADIEDWLRKRADA